MIHEVLFYLWNCPGDTFKMNIDEEWINSIDIEEFLHPSERKLLQKILSIGLQYHHIQQFIKLVESQPIVPCENICSRGTEQITEVKPGLYLKAVCAGIDEVLQDYRNKIINIEDTLLRNPQLSLTYVLSAVEKFRTLFEEINAMIKTIKHDQVYGCLLLGKLHTYIDCGVEPIVVAIRRILQSVNPIFYRQLCNWVIYGDLVDACNEFFVVDDQCADENFLHAEQKKSSNHSLLESFHETSQGNQLKRVNTVRKFSLKKEMVPPNISMETAETILFLGRVVWIIRNNYNQPSEDKFHLRFTRDVWNGKDIEYYRKLQILGAQPYNSAVFDNTIEECRVKITKYLWEVMIHEAKLLEHLQLIRDYFAIGRGELFQHFIVVAEDHLKESTGDYVVTNLNFMFFETARKLYGENDKSYLRFQLVLPNTREKAFGKNCIKQIFPVCPPYETLFLIGINMHTERFNHWGNLEMNFNAGWPLHILFHPKAMVLYNKLFGFLLRIKKTQIDLHKLWHSHMEGKRKIDTGVWTLRNKLIFIVNNLQYYFQVDVIEGQFSILKNSIQNANEFEDIIRLHAVFLKNLLTKTFVMTSKDRSQEEAKHSLIQIPELNQEQHSKVYNAIMDIIYLCDNFCKVANTWGTQLLDIEKMELARLKSQSDALIENLLSILYSLHKKASDHHLLQLLRHIDFNRWFSKMNTNLNLSVS